MSQYPGEDDSSGDRRTQMRPVCGRFCCGFGPDADADADSDAKVKTEVETDAQKNSPIISAAGF